MDMDDLLIKHLLGEATPVEIALVEHWLSKDSRNRDRYEQFRKVWEISGPAGLRSAPNTSGAARTNPAPDPQAALQRFRQRQPGQQPRMIDDHRWLSNSNGPGEITRTLRKWRVAAILAGLLGLGAGTWFMIHQSHVKSLAAGPGLRTSPAPSGADLSKALPSPAAPRRDDPAATAKKEQGDRTGNLTKRSVLPDGSVVTLNKQATIVYSSDGRTIRLQGEAFFAIAPNSSQPFVVQANDLTVTVLGTSFNIRSTTAGRTEVTVETGAVRISRSGESLLLQAGEKGTAEAGTQKIQSTLNTDPLYTWYLDRPLVCDSVPLSRIVEMLNKAYDAHIVIGRAELNDLPLTTVFQHQPLERILAMLAATADLAIVRDDSTIIIK